jgi:hypothetical protein
MRNAKRLADYREYALPNDPVRLSERGIAEKKASALLANLKPGQEVMDQIEYADHLIVQSPPGPYDDTLPVDNPH